MIEFHEFPKDRTLLERIARRFVIPPSKKKFFRMVPPPSNRFGTYEYRDARLKRTFPIRYFISETLPLEWSAIKRKWIDAIWWVRYRTTNRNHVIKIRSLKPGYHEASELMIHVCFQMLVDFVEIDLANANSNFEGGQWKNGRCPAAGLHYLDWEINDPECQMGVSPTQAELAVEKKFLYDWWTNVRTNRIDPWSAASIWKDWHEDPNNIIAVGKPHDQADRLEQFYHGEDQEMFERLVKIRRSIWL